MVKRAFSQARGAVAAALFFASALAAFAQTAPPANISATAEIRKSLVRISVTEQDANYRIPWTPGNLGSGRGAGFVIEGQRVMTNAHVVSNARYLSLERENDPKKYRARVEHVAHDCDLAVLQVLDESFFKGTKPLPIGGIPEVDSAVSVYGYPIGGERLSVTRGIVSRIDFLTYSHSASDSHLTIQVDAAINPGNSGGPVLQDGKVVGVAFQGYSGEVAQNVGYMIPTPVVQRFLKDIEDGRYDHYMDLSITTLNLLNPAMRRALGLPDDDRGVLVTSVASAGCSAGHLQVGDVLLAIDGHPIDSDAFVELEGERVQMVEIVERKFKGESVNLKIMRQRDEKEVTVPLDRAWQYMIQANIYDEQPRYVLFGGLLFQPLSRDFLEAYQIEDQRIRYFFNYFISDEIYREHPEVIVLSAVLPDPINTYLGDLKNGIVNKVNGQTIKTLSELAKAFEAPAEQYVIELVGNTRPIVLARAAVEEARERIRKRYRVLREQNLE